MEQIYLSRRNLLALLSKLDRKKNGENTNLSIIKFDNVHPDYSQTMDTVLVVAVENEDYYINREPGRIHYRDENAQYVKL